MQDFRRLHDLAYIDAATYPKLGAEIQSIKRMLNALYQRLAKGRQHMD
jgi:hypothetical protein